MAPKGRRCGAKGKKMSTGKEVDGGNDGVCLFLSTREPILPIVSRWRPWALAYHAA